MAKILSDTERQAYDYYMRQLYDATVGVLLAGAVVTGDTTPTTARTWDQLNKYERAHFSTHIVPVIRPLSSAVYCVNDLPKDGLL
jgi:hypothetical protein